MDELIQRQGPASRLILMSGTPHQGHPHRFENLLALLKRDDEAEEDLAGRVIYRTKDDVQDWDGNPLFPGRQVNEPHMVDLGPAHRAWLSSIHDFYVPPPDPTDRRSRRRAAGWRCAQALQWASSSVQAGLGYLVRQAVRVDWSVADSALREAVAALRPYRLGDPNEPVDSLFERLHREVERQRKDRDLEDVEEVEDDQPEPWEPDPELLRRLLRSGTQLLRSSVDRKWDHLWDRLLRDAGEEKVVLFAQPIETVTALSAYLQRRTGKRPALVVGGQEQEDRERQVENFWSPDGPQFLVSSRAGGEGINLQVARRLVHVDVPWNPMELEQRVGRIHRFGSRRKVVVDTLVASRSRETDAYRVARRKLGDIASALVPEDRFEGLFSRVMSLVPPTELQGILGERPLAPLSEEERRRVTDLVTRGFENWRAFHRRFSSEEQRIRHLDPGSASWQDVRDFARRHLRAESVDGFEVLAFRWEDGEGVESSRPADVVRLRDGKMFACGDFAGMPVLGPNGFRADVMGINRRELCDALRRLAFPAGSTGAAHLLWPEGRELPQGIRSKPFGLWIAARMTIRWQPGNVSPIRTRLVGRLVGRGGEGRVLAADEIGMIVRVLSDCSIRRQAPEGRVVHLLASRENQWIQELRTPGKDDQASALRHAVFPLFAGVLC